MDHKIKSATRLSIIFILAVVLSGSVLTYFSINNISNLKELTEKRIIEEQRELYTRFSSALQNRIETVTAGLVNESGQTVLVRDSLINRAVAFDFIIQPFILKNNGQFIYPNFAGIPERVQRPVHWERFSATFREGETAEFAEKDAAKAKKFYLLSLNYSTGKNDSVKALNALGRIAVKLNDAENASTSYSLIALNYFSVSDENGFPYVYYALPQLLKIPGSGNSERIVQVIEFSLEKMASGFISLNYSTEELLILVTGWLKGNAFNNPEQLSHINELIACLNKQLQFVNIYGNELTGLLEKNNWDNYYTTGNDFKIVNSSSGDSKEFFLINTSTDNLAGFLLNRNKLFDTLVKADLQEGFDFDYLIEFPDGYSANNNGSNLIYSSQLNPFFPGQLIRIKLGDEDLISDIIIRRSWIYGIASVLLLVAMGLGVVLILRDIAREKHLARLRSDFISNVTHELKTPLTSIRMYAESLIMGRVKSDSVQKEYLSVVVTETDRLKRMINNILEFSKMEKGKPDYHFAKSNLASILNESIQEMNYWFEKEQFDVATELDEYIFAEVDPEKMKQAIGNLLSNAIKYSTDTKKVFIRLFRKSDHVCIEVEDRGMGIPEDKLSRIFEEFYRIEQKESISGTGLGLTVVKEIIESHHGTISVTSEIGKGSRFTVTIPLRGI